jgi:hypothetical protein
MSDIDTKFIRVFRNTDFEDQFIETINCDGSTDAVKISNCHHGIIANKTFIGSAEENCVDIVQGGDYVIGPNDYSRARVGVSNITAKANIRGLLVRGDFGSLEWGMYSNYDRWFKLPKSSNLRFTPDAVGTVTVWFGELPKDKPPGVKVIDRRWLAYPYFIFRSIQQQLFGLKK